MSDLRYTETQFIEHLKTGLDKGFDCLICGGKYRTFTDLHGEVYCLDCGMVYQVIRCMLKEEWLTEKGLTCDDVVVPYTSNYECMPLYRAYWQETQYRLPLGTWIGEHKNRYTREDQERFGRWLYAHADEWRGAYEDRLLWDVIMNKYGTQDDTGSAR